MHINSSVTHILSCLSVLTLLVSCGGDAGSEKPAAVVEASEIYHWRLVTTWPKNFPGLGVGPERLAEKVKKMSFSK